jgi:hypothetical protein
MLRALLPFLCLFGLAGQAWGQTIKLTIRPQAEPVPALKYRLLPEVRDLASGNAALFYQRAHSPEWIGSFRRSKDYQKIHDWLELPLSEMPRDKVNGLLPRNALHEVDIGARRDHCDWQMLDRLRKDGIMMLLPDIQMFREYGTLLALRARLEMAQGKFDKAAYTLQTGFALARHLDQAPTLITGLVGLAIANIMCNQIETMIQLPDAPNFYWALADLPRPFISLRTGFQSEKISIDSMFPEVRAALTNPKSGPMSVQKVQETLDQLSLLAALSDSGNRQGMRFGAAVMAAKIYPVAKKYLMQRGRTPEQVDALPVVQVALMYALVQFDKHFDNFYKWHNLPFWEMKPGMDKAMQQLKLSKSKVMTTGGIPIAELFMPAVERVFLTRARFDRRIAALRCVEAIRLYAAAHQGKLPESLSDIKDVPIPIDPVTGKSFEYRVEKGKAILIGRWPQGQPATDLNTLRYELTLAASAKETDQ